jgi:GNAT superfamily N-acetyltransferase
MQSTRQKVQFNWNFPILLTINEEYLVNNSGKPKTKIPKAQIIRKAALSETNLVCEILGSAFAQDPVLQWISRHPEIYATLFRSEVKPFYMKHDHVFINETHTGAALWAPPGVAIHTPLHWSIAPLLWSILRSDGLKSIKRGLSLEKVFSAHRIKEPHYYLHAVGAVQGEQGKGIGSALLMKGLQICDASGSLAYLESSNIKNNLLYERFGFTVTGEVELPDSGPTVWLMLREPSMRAE